MSDENTGFAELTAISNFSFLQGGAHPQEMVQRAAHLGYQAVGLADRNTLAGVVRGHVAAREAGIRFVPGARLVTQCGFEAVCKASATNDPCSSNPTAAANHATHGGGRSGF
ncbi:MAG: PHP domain-containing protein, partial [Pseudomonadota bacterium]|nr:PHP domain-containing protein [Pseudomonadota bacterium]